MPGGEGRQLSVGHQVARGPVRLSRSRRTLACRGFGSTTVVMGWATRSTCRQLLASLARMKAPPHFLGPGSVDMSIGVRRWGSDSGQWRCFVPGSIDMSISGEGLRTKQRPV